MKKIIIAFGTLLLSATAFAQSPTPKHHRQTPNATTAPVRSTATMNTNPAAPQHAATQQATAPNTATSEDITVPDHAYQPAGTAGVGYYGNGTGGSTIGSTPASGGTGYHPAAATPAGQAQPNAASPQRSETR